MQTLGLTPAPRSDSRLKSLFWPTVSNDIDVDYLTAQGFWVCFLVATVTLLVAIASRQYFGVFDSLFFYMGGAGVRQRSRSAAICVFIVYSIGGVLSMPYAGSIFSVGRIFFTALLLSNVRAVWLAAAWRRSGSADESPTRLSSTLSEQISDRIPAAVWPKIRILFYIFAFLEVGGLLFVLLATPQHP